MPTDGGGSSSGRRARLRAEALEDRLTPAGIFATAPDPGAAPVITVFDAATRQQKFTINAFDPAFTGGVYVAVGDVNGDGTPDVIAGAGPGGGPFVNVFSGVNGTLLKTITVGDPTSRAGVCVAAADFEGTGTADLLLGGVLNGQPVVEIMRFSDESIVRSFTPFPGAQSVSVAAGDVNGDGTPDVIAGAGPGGGPQVAVFSGKDGSVLLSQSAFEDSFRGGAYVSAGDLNADGRADVVVAAGPTGGPRVVVFDGKTGQGTQSFFAYDGAERAGVRAALFDTTGLGLADVVTTDGPGQAPNLTAFSGQTAAATTAPVQTGLPAGPLAAPPTISPTDDSGLTGVLPNVNDPNFLAQPDGVKIWEVRTGSGTAVTTSSTIHVFYSGFLADGTIFDSVRSPNTAAQFQATGVIQGFQEGLLGMMPGGVRRIFIPAALGYGAAGSPPKVPANADLVFEVKLVSTT